MDGTWRRNHICWALELHPESDHSIRKWVKSIVPIRMTNDGVGAWNRWRRKEIAGGGRNDKLAQSGYWGNLLFTMEIVEVEGTGGG